MRVEYRVLGPLEVLVDGRAVPVPADRGQVLLATLLLRANTFVSTDELSDRMWDGVPPNPGRAKTTLRMAVTRLRQALGGANCVRTMTGGYLAEVTEDHLDLTRFRALVAAREWTAARCCGAVPSWATWSPTSCTGTKSRCSARTSWRPSSCGSTTT